MTVPTSAQEINKNNDRRQNKRRSGLLLGKYDTVLIAKNNDENSQE